MKDTTIARIRYVLEAAGMTSNTPDAIEHPVYEAILLALKAQDRDTRHACAEAILAAHQAYSMDSDEPMPKEAQAALRAHQACMNAQAI